MSLLLIASLFAADAPKPVQRLDFGEIEIGGQIIKPTDTYLVSIKRPKFGNLIKIRQNFEDKIVKSIDQM